MERIFEYETGFIKVSLVEHVHYPVGAGLDHEVYVFLVHKKLELTFDSKIKAEEFVKGLLKEVREFHGIPATDTGENGGETIDLAGMTADEILAMVAKIRINQHNGIKKRAADSLGVDIRTLAKYFERGRGQATAPETTDEI